MSGMCSKIFSIHELLLNKSCLQLSYPSNCGGCITLQVRWHWRHMTPKLKYPLWFLKKDRQQYDEHLTQDNTNFVKEVMHEKFGPPAIISGIPTYQVQSPLKTDLVASGEWQTKTRRCGVIARKIGLYPLWAKNGKIIWTTLLQVIDNHVIKYTPPEDYMPKIKPGRFRRPNRFGCLLVGAESADPQLFTKEYCGLFSQAGMMPKRVLGQFKVSPEAALQPGTPLYATHFSPGDVVDIRGKTTDRGFQGVMKRWGFRGMPASHGVTKTHRRPGNIGGGGEKGRVWPGTKMPGHMGNKTRIHVGAKIWRINTKYNVLWVQGLGVPGPTNSVVYIYDTILPLRKRTTAPENFPTYFPEKHDEMLPDDLYDDEVHHFEHPTITFQDT